MALSSAILLGAVITHTLVITREAAIDRTSHNLWPFEYLGILAYVGAILARLASGGNHLLDEGRGTVRTVRTHRQRQQRLVAL